MKNALKLMIFLFSSGQTVAAQNMQYSETYYDNVEMVELIFEEIIESTFVYLLEEDYLVRHQLKFTKQKDSIAYTVDYFEFSEPYKMEYKLGVVDILSVSIEENEFSDSRTHLLILTKANKIDLITKYPEGGKTLQYTSQIQIPIYFQSDFMDALQTSLSFLKNELLPFQPQADSTKIKTARTHVKEAVLQALNGFKPRIEEIKNLSKNKNIFIKKCQICLGVQDAIQDYLKNAHIGFELTIFFESVSDEELYEELQQFVSHSVQHYLSHPKFNDAEIELIRGLIDKERMRSIDKFKVKSCAACDGAATK